MVRLGAATAAVGDPEALTIDPLPFPPHAESKADASKLTTQIDFDFIFHRQVFIRLQIISPLNDKDMTLIAREFSVAFQLIQARVNVSPTS